MKYTFKYKISSIDIIQINQKKFKLPKVIFDFIPISKEILLKILIPNYSANIYSIIKNQNLILNEKSITFFNSLKKDECIFIAVFSKHSPSNEVVFDIHFSRKLDFLDLKSENQPIITFDTISYVKDLIS
jgi:hypothetical protein